MHKHTSHFKICIEPETYFKHIYFIFIHSVCHHIYITIYIHTYIAHIYWSIMKGNRACHTRNTFTVRKQPKLNPDIHIRNTRILSARTSKPSLNQYKMSPETKTENPKRNRNMEPKDISMSYRYRFLAYRCNRRRVVSVENERRMTTVVRQHWRDTTGLNSCFVAVAVLLLWLRWRDVENR